MNYFSECNDKQPNLFPGSFQNGQYTHSTDDPIPESIRAISTEFEATIKQYELFWSSETDSELVPVVFSVDGESPSERVKKGLGLAASELVLDWKPMKGKERFLFWGSCPLEAALEFLAEEEDIANPSDDELWDVLLDADGTDWDLFDEEQSEGFAELGASMSSHLGHAYHFSFDWDANANRYTKTPLFWGGFKEGYFVGVMALRVYT